ncbi:hypothetical protein FGG08_004488 [Glutinoglossum americanum]|uniref:glutathione transferase n=1 Tax=Glutinoglossum americanum TaxID=1670608 RepID=A0A9P8I7H9_9PEZI|nr:hypothetical protein FGG08_004488 [Glutinoglossum americanum]
MVLQLYGIPYSTCTQRVLITLHEKGVPYEINAVNLATGAHKDPEYMKKQPFGQVPCIDDDESRAICRYLAIKYADQGTPLIPPQSDLQATALFEQAASVEQADFDAFAGKLVFERVFKKKYSGLQPNEEMANNLQTELGKRLDVYDQILSRQPYANGSEFSLADIFHIPYGSLLAAADAGELIPERPHVKAWWDRITGRESWAKTKALNAK